MATEAAPVNGNYGPTSSHSVNLANGASSEATPAPQTGKDEVGWYFVEQYYTTMSRSPEKVHLFYNKRSQFVYGVEAEKVPVSVGQKAINERIAELGIEDCKVRVTNVDSQESGKSIILQVIGEMSVKGQPHRKFAQTFVLAEQPNGYFVLNDIFRYIADEPDEEDDEVEPADAPVAELTEPQDLPKTLSSSPNPAEQAQSAEIVNKKLEEVADEETTVETTSVEDPVVTEAGPIDEPDEPAEVTESDVKSVDEPALEPEKPKDPEPTPSATPAPPAAQAQPPKETATPAPAPTKPAAPKTWASMLAGSKAPPAVPVVPAQTNAPAQPKPTPAAAPSAPTAPAAQAVQAAQAAPAAAQAAVAATEVPSAEGWQSVTDHGKKQNRAQPSGNISGYIKNVSDKFFDNQSLRQHLSQYGKINYFDISRQKNCAFVEFESPAGYNAAVAANPHKVLGEDIIVEERRRPGMVGNNFRGGPRGGRGGPGGRGGFAPRGRGGPAGRGRGGAPDA